MSALSPNGAYQDHQMWHEFTLKDVDPEGTRERDERDENGEEYDDSDHDYDDQRDGAEGDEAKEEAPSSSRDDIVSTWEDPDNPWSR